MNMLKNKLAKVREQAKNNKGFTLVELIVVIVILAILIGVSVSGYSKYIGQSKLNTDIQNAETVRAAVVNAQGESGVYEELLGTAANTLVVEIVIDNNGMTITNKNDAAKTAFANAIAAQLQSTVGTANSKIKTQYSGGTVTIKATTPAAADGSATITVTGANYPNDKTAGILQPASGGAGGGAGGEGGH